MRRTRLTAKIITGIALAITAAVLFILAFGARLQPLRRQIFHAERMEEPILAVTYFYAGQGDAVLVRELSEGGRAMLIDTGPNAASEEFASVIPIEGSTPAATTIVPYLQEKGVEKIDYLVLTHKHGDHIGGAPYILRNFPVGTVYDNGTEYPSPFAEQYMEAVRETGVDFAVARAGDTLPFGENITAQFLGPLRRYRGTLYSDENSNSVVTRVAAGEVTFFFGGDIEIATELDLMAYGEDIRTTVMMAPHHGSHSSSSVPFLKYVRPEVAVFSAGRYNRYGLPSYEIVRRYEDLGASVYRTDIDGHIEIETDGQIYEIRTSR